MEQETQKRQKDENTPRGSEREQGKMSGAVKEKVWWW